MVTPAAHRRPPPRKELPVSTHRPVIPKYIGGGAPLAVTMADRPDTPPGVAVIVASGELDRETAPRLADRLVAAVGDHTSVDLDLDGITFIDSQGLRVLIEAKLRAGNDKRVRITAASTQVRQLLDMTGLTELLDG